MGAEPRQWVFYVRPGFSNLFVRDDTGAQGYDVAEVLPAGGQYKDNIKLIVAAPLLHATLQQILETLDDPEMCTFDARAKIRTLTESALERANKPFIAIPPRQST